MFSKKMVFDLFLLCFAFSICIGTTYAQDELGQFDIDEFDHNASRDEDDMLLPWADHDRTTLTVNRVANGSVTLDGTISSGEYGFFEAVNVVPVENAWVLNFPNDRTWDGVDDSRFSFWLTHDDDFLYIAADVIDDVVNVDDPNESNWKDDSIEVLFDALNTKYDTRDGQNDYGYGGHDGIDALGRQRAWDYDSNQPNDYGNNEFATGISWTNGPDGDVHAVGVETATGYAVEMRYAKRLFEDPDAGNKLENDYVMGFNIAVDDDDARGPGPDGNGPAIQSIDEEISYQWSHRERLIGWNAEEASEWFPAEIAAGDHLEDYELGFTANGRLTQGALGEIIFSDEMGTGSCTIIEPVGDFDGDGTVAFADFLKLSSNFGATVTTYADGDADCNGTVEFADFLALSANFGSTANAEAVPEPTGALLVMIALSGILISRRHRS